MSLFLQYISQIDVNVFASTSYDFIVPKSASFPLSLTDAVEELIWLDSKKGIDPD